MKKDVSWFHNSAWALAVSHIYINEHKSRLNNWSKQWSIILFTLPFSFFFPDCYNTCELEVRVILSSVAIRQLSPWQTWSQSANRNNRNATVEHKRQGKERSCHRRVCLRHMHREKESWRDGRESRDVTVRFLSKRFDLSLHSSLRTNPIWHDRKHLSKKTTWLIPCPWLNPERSFSSRYEKPSEKSWPPQKRTDSTVTEW